MSHVALARSPRVYAQLHEWLSEGQPVSSADSDS